MHWLAMHLVQVWDQWFCDDIRGGHIIWRDLVYEWYFYLIHFLFVLGCLNCFSCDKPVEWYRLIWFFQVGRFWLRVFFRRVVRFWTLRPGTSRRCLEMCEMQSTQYPIHAVLPSVLGGQYNQLCSYLKFIIFCFMLKSLLSVVPFFWLSQKLIL